MLVGNSLVNLTFNFIIDLNGFTSRITYIRTWRTSMSILLSITNDHNNVFWWIIYFDFLHDFVWNYWLLLQFYSLNNNTNTYIKQDNNCTLNNVKLLSIFLRKDSFSYVRILIIWEMLISAQNTITYRSREKLTTDDWF